MIRKYEVTFFAVGLAGAVVAGQINLGALIGVTILTLLVGVKYLQHAREEFFAAQNKNDDDNELHESDD